MQKAGLYFNETKTLSCTNIYIKAQKIKEKDSITHYLSFGQSLKSQGIIMYLRRYNQDRPYKIGGSTLLKKIGL